MNGWSKIGNGKRWHQVEARSVNVDLSCVRPLCDPNGNYYVPAAQIMDYRWRPPRDEQCKCKACQAEVEP